jgi:hypothetical protein
MASEIKANKISPATGTAFTLGDSGDTFTIPSGTTLDIASGATLANNGTATGFSSGFVSYALICNEQPSGTQGGTFTSGAWRVRDLNTEIADPDGIVSISSNQFTLGAGSYLIKWSAIGFRAERHKSALYDVTGTAYIEYGNTRWANTFDGGADSSTGMGRVTPSGTNVYEIHHRCQTTSTTYGLGLAGDSDTGSVPEKYTFVEIYKEA